MHTRTSVYLPTSVLLKVVSLEHFCWRNTQRRWITQWEEVLKRFTALLHDVHHVWRLKYSSCDILLRREDKLKGWKSFASVLLLHTAYCEADLNSRPTFGLVLDLWSGVKWAQLLCVDTVAHTHLIIYTAPFKNTATKIFTIKIQSKCNKIWNLSYKWDKILSKFQ